VHAFGSNWPFDRIFAPLLAVQTRQNPTDPDDYGAAARPRTYLIG
jgi:hypothetical protein